MIKIYYFIGLLTFLLINDIAIGKLLIGKKIGADILAHLAPIRINYILSNRELYYAFIR